MTGVTLKAGVASPCENGPGESVTAHLTASELPGASIVAPGGAEAASLALRVAPVDAGEMFEIAILDRDRRTLIHFGPFPEEDVVATWRGMGASSGLELVIQRGDGTVERPYEQIGRVQLGHIRVRRRHGSAGRRRPRFLVRRKTGRLPVRPAVYRGEREIAGSPSR